MVAPFAKDNDFPKHFERMLPWEAMAAYFV